jgi:hypothetical protein
LVPPGPVYGGHHLASRTRGKVRSKQPVGPVLGSGRSPCD